MEQFLPQEGNLSPLTIMGREALEKILNNRKDRLMLVRYTISVEMHVLILQVHCVQPISATLLVQ